MCYNVDFNIKYLYYVFQMIQAAENVDTAAEASDKTLLTKLFSVVLKCFKDADWGKNRDGYETQISEISEYPDTQIQILIRILKWIYQIYGFAFYLSNNSFLFYCKIN